MQIYLKNAWEFGDDVRRSELATDFRNIKEMWNDHDAGLRAWTSAIIGDGTQRNATFFSGGSFGIKTVTKTANYTMTESDHLVLVDSTSAAITITLPTAASITGRMYIVKDWKGTAGTNNITIDGAGSETIDGATTKVINSAYLSYTVLSDGTNWSIL